MQLRGELFEHLLVLALARDEQPQLWRVRERRREGAHGSRDVLDRGQARGDAAQHVTVVDFRAVVVLQVLRAVKITLRTVEVHTIVDFDDALGVEAALDQRARHAVGHRLVKVKEAQRDRVCRAKRVLLERVAQIVEPVIRVDSRQHGYAARPAHDRAHQVGAAAVAVDDIRLELVDQITHGVRRAQRVVPLNDAHVNAAFARLVRKRAGAERNEHHLAPLGKAGHHIHNVGFGAANVAAAHHMHHAQGKFLPRAFFHSYRQYTTNRLQMQNRSAVVCKPSFVFV